jgi:poly-beta-1,6-N-acetyl-D-glucosamine synthase
MTQTLSTLASRYVVVTPVRNEGDRFERTIKTVIEQSLLPTKWVIVNDGSTDGTGELAERYASSHHWMAVVHRVDRGFRSPGTGVIQAFYDGYRRLGSGEWEFLVKLDGDLRLEKDYFERCLAKFQDRPRLGIGGGVLYGVENGKKKIESNPRFHVRGATKIYKRECWEAIGGVLAAPGWDTLDEVKANMLGWETTSFDDVQILHEKPTGSADGTWRNAVKCGLANYISGYHPLFMFSKCLKRSTNKPYLVESLGLLWGFLGGYIKGTAQVKDPALIEYLRRQQMRCLLLQDSIWK